MLDGERSGGEKAHAGSCLSERRRCDGPQCVVRARALIVVTFMFRHSVRSTRLIDIPYSRTRANSSFHCVQATIALDFCVAFVKRKHN